MPTTIEGAAVAQDKCPECGSFKWNRGKLGETGRTLIVGGPLVLALGQYFGAKAEYSALRLAWANGSLYLGLGLFVIGVVLALTAKRQCANCGYAPSKNAGGSS
jgi:predicted nucleic-acid-binding Zn-ribbon protein